MTTKRIIGVVNIKNGQAVQSYGYQKYLPIGSPKIIVQNLDRWGADEILINAFDRSNNKIGPDFQLIKEINSLRIKTPIIYGGGIRNLQDASRVISLGADRILIENLIYLNLDEFKKISEIIGSQSIIISLPVNSSQNKKILIYERISKKLDYMNDNFKEALDNELASEILLIDYLNEGYYDKFNINIINLLKNINLPLICFGGISSSNKIKKIIKKKNINAIAIGNSLNYKEISIQLLKKDLISKKFRKPIFGK